MNGKETVKSSSVMKFFAALVVALSAIVSIAESASRVGAAAKTLSFSQ